MMLVSILFPTTPFLSIALSIFGIMLFVGYILYDTSEIIRTISPDDAFVGAIQLYLDVVNLFVFILQFLSSSRE